MLRHLRAAPLFLLLTAAACDSGSPTSANTTVNGLVFTRANGTRLSFAGAPVAWCGAWETGYDERPALHVLVRGNTTQPWWELTVLQSDIQAGVPLTFPSQSVGDKQVGAHMFVLDPPNEASTAELDATGSITFPGTPCSGPGGVAFAIDATLGSEFHDGPTIAVTGTFRGPTADR